MKSVALVAAAALAVTCTSFATAQAAQSPAQTTAQPAAKMATSNEPNTSLVVPYGHIRNVVATAIDFALTPKSMSNLVDLFPKARAHDIAQSSAYSKGYGGKLNDRIDSLAKDWKAKYGDTFVTANIATALTPDFASIQTHTAKDNPRMESATMTIQGNKNAGSFDVPLVCEDNVWKINVPSSLTAEKLRDNLQTQLSEVDSHAAHWPKSEADGYRMVAHHVLAAILDQPIAKSGQAMASPQQPAAKTAESASATVKPISATKTQTHPWYDFWNW